MRIVSQDKTEDINYNNFIITTRDNEVLACVYGFANNAPLLGRYVNKERALEVMEDIREKWIHGYNYGTPSQRICDVYEMPEK